MTPGDADAVSAESEAWAIMGGADSTVQRLRDEFAEAAGLPTAEQEPQPGAVASTAVANMAPKDVTMAVERKPDEIEWRAVTASLCTEVCVTADASGSYMIHRLAAKRAPLETVLAALEAFPEAIHERTAAGNLAYDLAVAAGAQPAVVDKLFIGHLQAMGELTALKDLLEREGGQERGLSEKAQRVLADTAKSRANLCVIDSLGAKKLGLSIMDRRLVCELISGSPTLVRIQAKQAEAAAAAQDGTVVVAVRGAEGPDLSLELALKHQAPGVVVSRLLEEQPDSHGTRSEGHLPLHWAAMHQAPFEVIDRLLSSQPGSAAVVTKADHLPAGAAPVYRDRASAGVSGQHIGGWPPVELRRSLVQGAHTQQHAAWPRAAREEALHEEAAAAAAAPEPPRPPAPEPEPERVSVTFAEGPMGVKWALPRPGEPFRLAFVAAGMSAAAGGLVAGMELREIDGQSIDEMRTQGLDDDAIIATMAKTRPLTLTLQSARPPSVTVAAVSEETTAAPLERHDAVGFPDRKEIWRSPCQHTRRKTRTEGYLPLHLAVSSQAESAVVQALLDQHPAAVREKDPKGNLPLHLAAKNRASGDVVHRLLYAYPDAAWTPTGWQNSYALHLAAEHHAPVEAVRLLVKVFPDAASIPRHGSWLPLHLAAANTPDLAVVQALDEAAPSVVMTENGEGNLPLHLAVEKSAGERTIDYLMSKNPDAWKRYNKFSSRAEAMGVEPLRRPGE